ncbi:hypothetical protein GCM10020369_78110 [Cryptosporangium minutisporangium]|uniref:Uncharacterized protein n=1 Tax=Cryptosporangium minutisporangium TaxID=113569 RepID=A0ABP6TAI5_9ACTN
MRHDVDAVANVLVEQLAEDALCSGEVLVPRLGTGCVRLVGPVLGRATERGLHLAPGLAIGLAVVGAAEIVEDDRADWKRDGDGSDCVLHPFARRAVNGVERPVAMLGRQAVGQ